MAGNKRPSFLKRQKEQQRTARAAEKREAKRLSREKRRQDGDEFGRLDEMGNPVFDDEPEGMDAGEETEEADEEK
ncbi:MAG: hypothetical protein ACRENS_11345 [Candidatus Eiseniibacteriota bacterium]